MIQNKCISHITFFIMLVISNWTPQKYGSNCNQDVDSNNNHYTFSLENNPTVTNEVSDKFLSLGLDSGLLRKDVKDLPFTNKAFINLALHLRPAYLRIGGTAADCLYFNCTERKKNSTVDNLVGVCNNFTLSKEKFLSLHKFSQITGLKIVFDLNALIRNTDGSWNSLNAKKVILFAKDHRMKLDWQLGNEPDLYPEFFNTTIHAKQLAVDYCKLRKLLDGSGYQESLLLGPELSSSPGKTDKKEEFIVNFLKNIRGCINYVTWHQYYLDGRIATVEDFINPLVFNRLSKEIKDMQEAVEASGHSYAMWLSETSIAYNGGVQNVSDRFVAGFLWLNKLGSSAKAGVQVVVRQTLFGGNYAMIGPDFEPNPDWWVAVLYKKFVSKYVLNLIIPNNLDSVRLFAHYALNNSLTDESPRIVIYGMNLNEQETNIYLNGLPKHTKVFSFFLTSEHLQSRTILLNGKILKFRSDGSLPRFDPKIVDINKAIVFPAFSMTFLLLCF